MYFKSLSEFVISPNNASTLVHSTLSFKQLRYFLYLLLGRVFLLFEKFPLQIFTSEMAFDSLGNAFFLLGLAYFIKTIIKSTLCLKTYWEETNCVPYTKMNWDSGRRSTKIMLITSADWAVPFQAFSRLFIYSK